MTAFEAYEKFLIKVNKNDSNANVNVSKGKFVVIFNEQAPLWLKEQLKKKLSLDELNELQNLLVDEQPLDFDSDGRNHMKFKLPSDFFYLVDSYSLASKDKCSERVLENWDAKNRDVRILLKDENNKPSFDYEETFIQIASDKVKIYVDDFKIKKVFLTYYRRPKKIDLEGYIKVTNQPSTTIDPDLSDYCVDQIISRCAVEATRNNQNSEGFQFAKERTNSEF